MSALESYSTISIAFEVHSVFDIPDSLNALGETSLHESSVDVPYLKDYDSIDGQGPTHWEKRFDISNWAFFSAWLNGQRIGGATLACRTPGLEMLDGRNDLAVLWDIRVSLSARGSGVGSALFRAAELWAIEKGYRNLKIETQNINVPACKFYSREGCKLYAANRLVYPDFPHEIQLLWRKDL